MYEDVKKEKFKVPGGAGGGGALAETFFNPEKQGWLMKEGEKGRGREGEGERDGRGGGKGKRCSVLLVQFYFSQVVSTSPSTRDGSS